VRERKTETKNLKKQNQSIENKHTKIIYDE
jgi:hypothetical protein